MHEYLRFFGTNNQQKVDHFLIYERDLLNEKIKNPTEAGFLSLNKY